MITVDEYLSYVDTALDGMVQILSELGDDLANTRPDLPDANSPYAILTHCLGVMEYWGGHVVAGRPNNRDRDAEFRATGVVSDLLERVRTARGQLAADATAADPSAPAPNPPPDDLDLSTTTHGAVLLHVYEELAQHHGQLEITRDVLRAQSSSSTR